MARDIVVDPDQLTGLANDVVGELSAIETKHRDLHSELDGLILGCDPRYRRSSTRSGTKRAQSVPSLYQTQCTACSVKR
ncbi:hypothetical protein GPJ55_22685 [Bacillus subtilis]|nr:hypothetical protein GPJ55_22685 [Bacillus subtilis]